MAPQKWLAVLCVSLVMLASACSGKIKPDEDNEVRGDAEANAAIGEIIITNREARRVLESDTISLPNCGGSQTLEIRRNLSKQMTRIVELTKTEPEIPLSEGVIVEAVRALFKAEPDETVTGTADVTLTASPGTIATFPVTWSAVGVVGVVEARVEDRPYFQEFWLLSELVAEVGEPDEEICDDE